MFFARPRFGADRLDVKPQRTTVDWNAAHVVNIQTMAAEQCVGTRNRKVAEMFMIDGVELAFLDQIAHIRKLDNGHAIVPEHRPDAGDKIVRIGNMRDDIIGDKQVGCIDLRASAALQVLS